jgi:DNA-binding transcriptional LysR family regulator
MFEWDDARYFLAIQRAGSLSEAGRRLRVNQSTVGRRLQALEHALGTTLFVRTADGYFLSPAGERLLRRAERMEDEALALEREASGRESSLTGTVRVTGPDALSVRIVLPILAEMRRRMPGLDFELVAENRTLSLTKREADVAVRTFRPSEPSLVARKICTLGSALYASAQYLERHGAPKNADFNGHAFIGTEDPAWQEAVWIKRRAPGAHVVLKTNSTPAQLAATIEGMGIGILPCYLADEQPLVRVAPAPVIIRDVWLTLHKDLQHQARVRACADLLVEGILAEEALLAGAGTVKEA